MFNKKLMILNLRIFFIKNKYIQLKAGGNEKQITLQILIIQYYFLDTYKFVFCIKKSNFGNLLKIGLG